MAENTRMEDLQAEIKKTTEFMAYAERRFEQLDQLHSLIKSLAQSVDRLHQRLDHTTLSPTPSTPSFAIEFSTSLSSTLFSSQQPQPQQTPLFQQLVSTGFGFQSSDYPQVMRRKKLPDPVDKEKAASLWSIIKDNIGKDLTSVCLPVYFNEPLSSLQKCCEDLEYSYLLDRAYEWGQKGNNLMRLLDVATFAVSGYSSTLERSCKPFNPLLGETYEANFPNKGFRFIFEKLDPVGVLTIEFDDREVFRCSKVTTSIYNLILGKLYCDHHGTIRIEGHREYSCKVKFKEHSIMDKNPRGGDNHVAIGLVVQHIHTKLGQHDLCKIYPNVSVIKNIQNSALFETWVFKIQHIQLNGVFNPFSYSISHDSVELHETWVTVFHSSTSFWRLIQGLQIILVFDPGPTTYFLQQHSTTNDDMTWYGGSKTLDLPWVENDRKQLTPSLNLEGKVPFHGEGIVMDPNNE